MVKRLNVPALVGVVKVLIERFVVHDIEAFLLVLDHGAPDAAWFLLQVKNLVLLVVP